MNTLSRDCAVFKAVLDVSKRSIEWQRNVQSDTQIHTHVGITIILKVDVSSDVACKAILHNLALHGAPRGGCSTSSSVHAAVHRQGLGLAGAHLVRQTYL